MTLRPLHDYILIEPDQPLEFVGGILVSRSAKHETETGKVIAHGVEADVTKGDRIMFRDYSLIPVKDGDKEYVFIRYSEVICKL